ncbi:hypothetical protein AXG93_1860s1290 [Marchantia polymorpha subsp. ruderalis]|uniref:Uncharacterized protein n=1 Tax=Marchantia polymorpha subsp. ruderalis TaxID=1480154 RepID=A0A176VEJ8_MARPO|nr:hypothetical protein AXG93_1860s1290 [Marchantia polymorpha subsp. ruderalis]
MNKRQMAFGEGSSDVPMDDPLAKNEEREDETKTETLDQCLWPSEQPLASLAEDLRPSAKKLADCEAAQTSKLERGKELDADCNGLRSQQSAVEE